VTISFSSKTLLYTVSSFSIRNFPSNYTSFFEVLRNFSLYTHTHIYDVQKRIQSLKISETVEGLMDFYVICEQDIDLPRVLLVFTPLAWKLNLILIQLNNY